MGTGGGGTALVTGANRGIGPEVARQLARRGFTAIVGARYAERGEAAAAQLRGEGLDAEARTVDVADAESVAELGRALERDPGRGTARPRHTPVAASSQKPPRP